MRRTAGSAVAAGLLVLGAAGSLRCTGGEVGGVPATGATPPNIVLITIDTLRADHLGCYGYGRPTSPNIDALARRGIRFDHCYAPSSWTVPSMMSLITGVSPAIHGIVHGDIRRSAAGQGGGETGQGEPGDPAGDKMVVLQEMLADAWTTLPEALQGRGYATAGFSTNGHLIRAQGYAQGFADWDESCAWQTAACVNRRVFEWLESSPKAPFFLWVHYFDPHHDTTRPAERRYDPPPPYDTLFGEGLTGPPLGVSRSIALYDGEVRATDAAVGALLERVERATKRPALVVFTADHGDEFLERGNWYHAKTVYDELIRVPLIVVLPGEESAGRAVRSWVSLQDLLPTLLESAGVPPLAAVEGTSLRPLLARKGGEGSFPRRPVYSETRRWDWLDRRCWIQDGKKMMVDMKTGGRALYDLEADPREARNLIAEEPERASRMLMAMRDYLERAAHSARPVPLRPEEDLERIETLRSLGYLK